MNSKALLAIAISLLFIAVVAYFWGRRGKPRNHTEIISHPPFIIKKKNTYSSRYDFNTASRRDDSRSYYSIIYQEEAITFPDALNQNTGVPGLWKVYILKDAPQPALLAGSKALFLITEENGTYQLTAIPQKTSNFISLQWLDSEDGQPGPKSELFSSNDTGIDCLLTGGQFLLINKNVVLDIHDLSLYPFEVENYRIHDYSANNVIGFSPDQEQIVYLGSKYEGVYHHALLVCNFKANQVQLIPFDRTATRLHDPYSLPPDWLLTYFNWKQREDGSSVLEQIEFDTLPNWEGHFSGQSAYSVSPVKEEMVDTLAAFTQAFLQLDDADVEYEVHEVGNQYNFKVGESRLKISYLENLGTAYFSDHILDEDEEQALKIIKKVGMAFNEKLRAGAHQSLFTQY